MSTPRQQLGQRGEQLAAHWLHNRGWHILTRNWRAAGVEIDLVAQDGPSLVFVEVRTRRNAAPDSAWGSFGPHKCAHMVRAAYTYLSAHSIPEDTPWRIDAIVVILGRGQPPHIEHMPDALSW